MRWKKAGGRCWPMCKPTVIVSLSCLFWLVSIGLAAPCLGGATVGNQENAAVSEGTHGGNPNVIMEYAFDGEIAEVITGVSEMTVGEAVALGRRGFEGRSSAETVKVEYPRIVVTREVPNPGYEGSLKSLVFYDKNSRILKEIQVGPKTLIFPSVSQGYVGLSREFSGGESRKYEADSTRFRLLDATGKQVLAMTLDGGQGFIVANNGNFLAFQAWEGGGGRRLSFYNSAGDLLGATDAPGGEYFSLSGAYSSTGNYIAIAIDLKGLLTLFDHKGKELWRRDLKAEFGGRGSIAEQLIISPDEKHIYLWSMITDSEGIDKHHVFCLDMEGRDVLRRDDPYLGRFSPDGGYLAIFQRPPVLGRVVSDGKASVSYGDYGLQNIELIDLATRTSIWTHTEQNVFINSVDVSNGGERLVCAVEEGADRKNLLWFGKTGTILCDLPYASMPSLSTGASAEGASVVRFGRVEGEVWLADGDRLELLRACP